MTRVALDISKHKNGNINPGRQKRHLAADLKSWLADLDITEAWRREQLHQIAELRADVYRHAKAYGVTPTMLRATRQLIRNSKENVALLATEQTTPSSNRQN